MIVTGHILIIDDEAALRKTLARILQQAGFEVTTAENGEQGMGFIKSMSFDLVYLDLRMPGLHGLEVLHLIHESLPSLPVILFTAQPDLNSAVQALRSGATDYLLKPIKPQILIERTRTILANQQVENRKREIILQMQGLQTELKNLGQGNPDQPAPRSDLPGPERFLKVGSLVLDLLTKRLLLNEEVINLPPTSFDYLLVLARHAPHVVDYQTLVAEAQGYQAGGREAQDLTKWHIHQLRLAVEQDAHHPAFLINVRGKGYRLVPD